MLGQITQQFGDAGVLVLGVEGEHQGMALIGQLQTIARQLGRHAGQRLLQVQGQLLLAQLVHQHLLVFHQNDPAFADHPDTVGHLLGLLDVVGGQNDGHAALTQTPHHVPHVAAQLHVDTGGGLIEKQYLRLVRQRLGDHHPALHAAGQFHDLGVTFVPQRQILEQLLQVGRVRLLAKQATAELDRRPDGFEYVADQLLRHQADLRAGRAVVADDVVTADQHLALARIDDAANDADQGGLAGAVGAEQGEDLALANVQVNALQGRMPGRVDLVQLLDGNDRLHGGWPLACGKLHSLQGMRH